MITSTCLKPSTLSNIRQAARTSCTYFKDKPVSLLKILNFEGWNFKITSSNIFVVMHKRHTGKEALIVKDYVEFSTCLFSSLE